MFLVFSVLMQYSIWCHFDIVCKHSEISWQAITKRQFKN